MQISNRANMLISADDFGLNKRANHNILYLISLGKIDRVAVMMRGEISAQEALELINSGVKMDIHLDLTSRENKQTKGTNLFIRIFIFLKNYFRGTYNDKIVMENWENQIAEFKKLFGKYPDGINSHEHIHFFPPLFKLLPKIQQKYPIPFLRFGSEGILTEKNKTGLILSILHKANNNIFKNSSFVSSNHLVSLDWIKNLDLFLTTLETGTTEIVCHPHRAEEFVMLKNNF